MFGWRQRRGGPPSPPPAGSSAYAPSPDPGTPIRITIGDEVITGTLWDIPAGTSLVGELPLQLTFDDHGGAEKTGRLPEELSMEGMPRGDDPEPTDIGYYTPSSDLVFYYGDVVHWNGIAVIGKLDGDLSLISRQQRALTATIERAN